MPAAPSSMAELAEELLRGEDAWVVGRRGPGRAARATGRSTSTSPAASPSAPRARTRRASGGAVFPLSVHHGGWRVALDDGRTVDFSRSRAARSRPTSARATSRSTRSPSRSPAVSRSTRIDGAADLERGVVRVVSPRVFDDDPLRLLRAVRLEDELGFRLDAEAEALVREGARSSTQPAGERILDELRRLSADGYERLAELGLLEPLGGSLSTRGCARSTRRSTGSRSRSATGCERLPISSELAGSRTRCSGREPPADDSPRAIHRFRRATEPWALEALAYLGRRRAAPTRSRVAREHEPARAAPARRRARLPARPGGRAAARAGRGGARSRHDLDERGGAGACPTNRWS